MYQRINPVHMQATYQVMRQKFSPLPAVLTILSLLIAVSGCDRNSWQIESLSVQSDLSIVEEEIESRLREYEQLLREGDSIALGDMYTEDAEVIPSTVGRDEIIGVFNRMIRDSITGSSFTTVHLWGNDQLLVEEGRGTWSHVNGEVVSSGRYLLVWKKEDGEWKILRDTWFPDKKD